MNRSTLNGMPAKIIWLLTGCRLRCWSSFYQVLIEMLFQCWSKCCLSADWDDDQVAIELWLRVLFDIWLQIPVVHMTHFRYNLKKINKQTNRSHLKQHVPSLLVAIILLMVLLTILTSFFFSTGFLMMLCIIFQIIKKKSPFVCVLRHLKSRTMWMMS